VSEWAGLSQKFPTDRRASTLRGNVLTHEPCWGGAPSRIPMSTSHPRRLHSTLTGKSARIRSGLLKWYKVHARELPWRIGKVSPYAVLVSEIMCQQTQVKTVVPYFERWMAAFPTYEDLAIASVDDVMRLWSGLGYYSRGKKLLCAARNMLLNGVPTDLTGWKRIPGCGDYTAGAVSRYCPETNKACDEYCVRDTYCRC
jgi:adenine-specific DNA glycosylase